MPRGRHARASITEKERQLSTLISSIAMSHAPQLLAPAERWHELPTRIKGPFHPKPDIEQELTMESKLAKKRRCNEAIADLRRRLAAWSPDLIIVAGDDQHENLLDDNMPPFVIYTGEEVNATQHFLYFGTPPETERYRVHSSAAKALLEGLMDHGFDPAWSQFTRDESGLGHAFGRVLKFLDPEKRLPVVPVMVNTYYPPAPNAKRCFDFGVALRRVIEAMPGDLKVTLIGSGGLAHTVIDEEYDRAFLRAVENNDADYFRSMDSARLVEGTSEIRNWALVAGAMNRGGTIVDYVPCYRNADGVGCGMGFAYWE
jgi:3-O-methylgallate 3,4-dioxygenase